MITLLPQTHLYLQRLEVIRDIGFDLPTHSLPRPLLETTELLVDIHGELRCIMDCIPGQQKPSDSPECRMQGLVEDLLPCLWLGIIVSRDYSGASQNVLLRYKLCVLT